MKRLLVWSDSVTAGTGFGVVAKHVLKALHKSGQFEVDQLAINHDGKFVDLPYQIVPSRLNNPKDPYGNQMFLEAYSSGKYDYVWVMNDTFVVEQVARKLPSVVEQMRKSGRKVPKLIYYYPVDCQVLESATTLIRLADIPVAYCNFGFDETVKILPDIKDRLEIVNHGVDTSEFFPMSAEERQQLREKFLNVKDPETFVWVQVNRNSPRKDIPRTILAFKKFKETVTDNTVLYLHTAAKDTTIDLMEAVKDVGLDPTKDVIFPKNYLPSKPFPIQVLNLLYNCGDGFLTTTLGEGWGLTHLEAASAGLPLVCPDNTCFPEQLAAGERGYLYPCKEKVWIDNSGYRPYALLDDIVDSMAQCREDVRNNKAEEKVKACKEYIDSIQWFKIGKKWVDVFNKAEKATPRSEQKKKKVGEVL